MDIIYYFGFQKGMGLFLLFRFTQEFFDVNESLIYVKARNQIGNYYKIGYADLSFKNIYSKHIGECVICSVCEEEGSGTLTQVSIKRLHLKNIKTCKF